MTPKSAPEPAEFTSSATNSLLKQTNYRWVIVALLFFATTINYLDRQVISLLKPILEKEFSWTESDYGNIVTVFTFFYGASTLLAGYIIDRVGTKLGYIGAILVWSFAAMAHALAGSTFGFMIARAFLGIGEAGNFPASIKTVAEWFPKKERALAVGIFNAGANIGAVAAPAVVPWLALVAGWQTAFIVTGALGFVWIIAWWFYYEIPSRHKRVNAAELAHITAEPSVEAATAGDAASTNMIDGAPVTKYPIFANRAIWGFMSGKLLTDPIWWFFLFWLPSYLANIYHLDLKKLGAPLIVIYLAATIGSVGGGWLSSKLIQQGWHPTRARQWAMALFAICVTPVMLISQMDSMWPVIAILSLAVAAHQAWSANIFTVAADQFPKQVLSRVVGLGTMAGTLGGAVFPLLVGRILDHFKALDKLSEGYYIIFYIAGLAYLVAWSMLYIFVFRRVNVK
ncbi:MFS transporter, ACS family, hexuronate transporter [Spirosoma endophyticum]|uniref:MFS transporter, ACS family, hexuronate transporter n=1 Tax=Spirosoma endophyticum TaxID=662367 RepID=A0A1I1VKA0_9BACT|nr:MFS transporter, ACS family, hexuronate transporter [Spirosoma endophyticum]